MTTSSEPNPEQSELSTQELPTIPTVQEMKTWDAGKVLRWIQQRDPNILVEEDDLNNFKKARIGGRAFLVFSIEDFKTYDLPLTVAVALKDLTDEVKEESKLSNQTAGRKRNEDETDPPLHLRLSRNLSPPLKRSKAPLPSQEDAFRDNDHVLSRWQEFYTRASVIRDKGPCGKDLEKHAKEEPVDLFNAGHTTLNAIDETFEKIEKEESYNFPKDDDPTLYAACEALSHALQKASRAKAEHDTPEVTQALDNLRKTYDEAAKSNTVSMQYIDIEPPYIPFLL